VTAVVDLGCGIGQLAMALKEVFPGAAVTGIDVAAPMLRYGHQRASALGLEVDFVQALAQSTPLPSGSVDLITAYLLFHEVPQSVGRDICAEAFRLLRPGGVFDVSDFPSGSLRQASPAYAKYRSWLDHHYNGERWSQEFVNSDFIATLESVGFSAELRSSKIAWVVPNYVARKPDV
jgi:ubiquinone/menaquinone biosynthesis C-methylase UbiE